MKVTVYDCGDPHVVSRKAEILQIAREAFDDVPEQELEDRYQKYPEIALAEDAQGIGGFVFLTYHSFQREEVIGLRFIAVGDRCRSGGLSTLLTAMVLMRKYYRYLPTRVLPGGPRQLYVMTRVCNPKAFYTLTKGNAGVSPDLGAEDPLIEVRNRAALYAWLGDELGLENFDPKTAIVSGGAADAGIHPQNTRVQGDDQRDWEAYVPVGSEILMLMPVDWKLVCGNALRFVKLFKPAFLRKY